MNNKKKFENFLESLKGNDQDKLIESVKRGFQICMENDGYYTEHQPLNKAKSRMVPKWGGGKVDAADVNIGGIIDVKRRGKIWVVNVTDVNDDGIRLVGHNMPRGDGYVSIEYFEFTRDDIVAVTKLSGSN